MSIWRRLALLSVSCVSLVGVTLTSSSGDAELQLQLANLLFDETR